MEQFAIGAPQWLVPAAVIGAVLLLIVIWAYVVAPASRWTRLSALALKVAALAAILLCLLEPLASGTRPRPQANIMAVVVDNSQSMLVGDGQSTDERRDEIVRTIRQTASWRERLEQDFDVRDYAFDARLFAADDFESLPFDGYASSLFHSLETLGTRYRHRPVAGLLLFSDGNATDLAARGAAWAEMGFPIYPVVTDGQAVKSDLAIAGVSVNQSNFEAAPVTLQVELSRIGLEDEKVVTQLINEAGEVVQEQVLGKLPPGAPASVRFRFRPEQSGVNFYRVVAFPESQRESFEKGENGAEASLVNNSRLVTVQGRRGPYHVLYVGGRPNWEFKFLRRAVQEDDEIDLVGLVRIAREEPKFSFGDFNAREANPFFQGFDDTLEETAEQYDEPVLLRLGVDEGHELKGGFPNTDEELFSYDAIILDDLEAAFFTEDQMLRLRRFVSARGGGLLFLGGPDTFEKGRYDKTPLGELSPVYVNTAKRGPTPDKDAYRLELTRVGWLEPWTRLRDTEIAEEARLQAMPDFKSLSRVGREKAGASVLATIEAEGPDARPALVVQRFGKGRSAALLVGDMWRWAMHQEEQDNQDLQQAWRQMIRWIVSDVPRRAELKVEMPDDPSLPVELDVRAYDAEFLPLDNAAVELKVRGPDGQDFTLTAEPSGETAGLYTTRYWPREQGGYHVEAVVTTPDGTKMKSADAGWTAEPAAGEYRSLEPNREVLEQLAERSGGEIVSLDDLDDFVAGLPNRHVPVTEKWVYPMWHQPWVLGLAVLCLCAEWGLRRLRGLP